VHRSEPVEERQVDRVSLNRTQDNPASLGRSCGGAFDRVSSDYHRHRPGYPDQLIDRACEIAGLEPESPVLEIGCGTGQLTRSLLARGLRVTAIEPGAQLAGLARAELRDAGDLDIVNARFEDAALPRAHFRAAFSASAMHWIDPDVGWQRTAAALAPGGTLALIQYFGLDDRDSADDQQSLLNAMCAVAPDIVESWPHPRDLETSLVGVRNRRSNISEAWSWLGGYDLARDEVGHLFHDVQIDAQAMVVERTAAEVCALLGTMSFWSRLTPEQRAALQDAIQALQEQLRRPFRANIVACLVSARRAEAVH
jgi:SAM-dependent methyltransferase